MREGEETPRAIRQVRIVKEEKERGRKRTEGGGTEREEDRTGGSDGEREQAIVTPLIGDKCVCHKHPPVSRDTGCLPTLPTREDSTNAGVQKPSAGRASRKDSERAARNREQSSKITSDREEPRMATSRTVRVAEK